MITPSLSAGRRGGAAADNRRLARTAHDHVLDDTDDIRGTSIHEPPGAPCRDWPPPSRFCSVTAEPKKAAACVARPARRRSGSHDRAPESSASTRSLAENLLAAGLTDARFPRFVSLRRSRLSPAAARKAGLTATSGRMLRTSRRQRVVITASSVLTSSAVRHVGVEAPSPLLHREARGARGCLSWICQRSRRRSRRRTPQTGTGDRGRPNGSMKRVTGPD